MAATWFFEGRIRTLLRPTAAMDRLVYSAVANIAIGIVGSLLVLRFAIANGIDRRRVGFGARTPSALLVVAGIVLGLILYFAQGAPSADAVVIINAYAQVFVVSAAEVLVCWAAVGGIISATFGGSHWSAKAGGALVASALFGIYHFAHSPPFNAVETVALLSLIGLITSLFFFVSQDVYATIAFHNFLGVFGIVQALAAAGQLENLRALQAPLIATAIVVLALLVAGDNLLLRRDQRAGERRKQ